MSTQRPLVLRLAGPIVPMILLAACTLGPDFTGAPQPVQTQILPSAQTNRPLTGDGHTQKFSDGSALADTWWTGFGSDTLSDFVVQAQSSNPSVRAAQSTLLAAQDYLQAGYGIFFPQIGATVAGTRQRSAINLGQGVNGIGPYNVGTASVMVSYTPDLFGAQRRTVEALDASVDEQRYQLQLTNLTLAANVATTAMARSAYAQQCSDAEEWMRLLDEQLALMRTQLRAGTTSGTDVAAVQSQRAVVQASLASLQQRLDQADHLLHQLLGKGPADATLQPIPLDTLTLPVALPRVLPAQLVHQRPDVLVAESQLHQASAHIGIATANLFPSLSLSAAGGNETSLIAQTLHAGTRVWSAQAALTGSIFSGGSQWATRKAAIDAYDASLAQYESTVLAAFTQVADLMQALSHDADTVQASADALQAARVSLNAAQANVKAGVWGRIDWIAVRSQWLSANMAYSGAKAQRLQDTVALYAALGGHNVVP